MSKLESYQTALIQLSDWESFLRQESGLPGPRGNLELAQATAQIGHLAQFERFIAQDNGEADTPQMFVTFCGIVGLGKYVAQGEKALLKTLRRYSDDPRWRMREAVAIALQIWGETNMDSLIIEMEIWSGGSTLEKRAAAAALCEPKLLHDPVQVNKVLVILDRITASILETSDRKNDGFIALRKALGYCWSVAAVAAPESGKAAMEHWFESTDKDIRWIMKENLKKQRLIRMDADWVSSSLERLA